MNTEEALTTFATVILVVAIFSVIVFVLSKVAQFQRSRKARAAFSAPAETADGRTQWSDDAFGVPAPPPLLPEGSDESPTGEPVVVDIADPPPLDDAEPLPAPPLPPPPLPVPPPPPAPPLPAPEAEVAPPAAASPPAVPSAPGPQPEPEQPEPAPEGTGEHWVLGASPFLPTPRGGKPATAAIHRRYWQNLAATNSSEWLGAANVARLSEGKPPQRTNRRSGQPEELEAPRLEEPGDEQAQPRWPSQAEDPFAEAAGG